MLRHLPSSFPKWQDRFIRPVIRLEDACHVSLFFSPHILSELAQRLSDRYLSGSAFYLRLETTDGDTYLSLRFQDLPYFFEYQSSRLWTLELQSAPFQGHEIFLRFRFDPLSKEPNAYIKLVSPHAVEILEMIHSSLQIEAPDHPAPDCLHRAYTFVPTRFDLQHLVRAFRVLSDYWLDGVPAVSFVTTHSGLVLKGLSNYQLIRCISQYGDDIQQVCVSIHRLVTGQNLSFTMDVKGRAFLSIMWGDPMLQVQVAKEVEQQLQLIPSALQQPPSLLTTCSLDLSRGVPAFEFLSEEIEMLFSSLAVQTQLILPARPHQAWEETLYRLQSSDIWLVDLSFFEPSKWFYLGVAHLQGKRILAITQFPVQMPQELQEIPLLTYEPSEEGISQLIQQVQAWLG